MNHKEAFILIVICACIVFFERSLPWIVFGKKEMPKIVKRLSDLLPASLMVILVVYSLRSLTTSDFHDSFALISASIFTAVDFECHIRYCSIYHFIKCILKKMVQICIIFSYSEF